MFFLFFRYKFHPALRTVTGMFCDYLGMHRARVLLFFLLFVFVLVMRAIEVNRPYLCSAANRQRRCTDKDKNPFLHFAVFCSGSRVGGGGLRKCRRHACRYSGRLASPKTFGAR